MSAADDLRDLRDALDSIAHGDLPRWGAQTTKTGQEATSAAIEVYEKFVRAMFAESAAKVAIDAAQRAEDQHRTHAEVLTTRCEAAEAERDAIRARVASMMESMSMSCEEPPAKLREKVRTLEAALTTETRVALDYQKLIDERRQLRARLVECRAWAGRCPYPNSPLFDELILVRELVDDTLEEVKP